MSEFTMDTCIDILRSMACRRESEIKSHNKEPTAPAPEQFTGDQRKWLDNMAFVL